MSDVNPLMLPLLMMTDIDPLMMMSDIDPLRMNNIDPLMMKDIDPLMMMTMLIPIKARVNVVARRKNTFFAITRQVYNGFCSSWYQIAKRKKLFDTGRNI